MLMPQFNPWKKLKQFKLGPPYLESPLQNHFFQVKKHTTNTTTTSSGKVLKTARKKKHGDLLVSPMQFSQIFL